MPPTDPASVLDLTSFAARVSSQNGEDGILEHLFGALGVERGTFCEFGAWDGQFASNAYALYRKGWVGWYIEADPERYRTLTANISRGDVEKLCARVSTDGAETLDNLLSRDGVPPRLDLLSIDIDSDDLAVWQSIRTFRARVVVIEYNPTIPIDIVFVNPRGENKGNSARAIYEFAMSIGYALVAVTAGNLVFVDAREAHQPFRQLSISDLSLPLGERYFFGYDGTLLVQGVGPSGHARAPEILKIPWHKEVFTQPLPAPFRRYESKGIRRRLSLQLNWLRTFLARPR